MPKLYPHSFNRHARWRAPNQWTLFELSEEGLSLKHLKMIKGLVVLALAVAVAIALPKVKRQAFGFGAPQTYTLPDGVEFIVGQVRSTFTCQGRIYGYYADQDNNCQIFHVCNPVILADGTQQTQMFSFFCGNQTIFDQARLVCAHPDDALPCNEAHNYLGVNDLFFRTERPQFIQG